MIVEAQCPGVEQWSLGESSDRKQVIYIVSKYMILRL